MARTRAPIWFWIAVVVLILWGIVGVLGFHASFLDSIRATMDPYDRKLYDAWPVWYAPVYGIAVWSGLIGSVLLALRRRVARPVYVVSLVGVIIMFGWTFVATDLIAVKGVVTATAFPIVIALICVFEIWLAGHAARRGWIG
ncbi:hypothetical protein [Sphingomonas sp.]|uniref:hypothetical protein n=1 Tax=Sphingomonas sp. TaxID=28214 RepID=UPI0035BC2248